MRLKSDDKLSETKSAAEEAKNAADKLAVAEAEVAGEEKQSRDADKKLGLEREERVRCEAPLSRWRFISQNLLSE